MTPRISVTFFVCVAAVPIAVLALLGGADARDSSATFAPRIAATASPQVSANWSGYVAAAAPPVGADAPAESPLTFSNVTGSWRLPKARCVKGRADAAAFWVGIGGSDANATALEQVGTTAQCNSRGVVTYYAWWEIVPAPAIRLSMKVRPGDRVTAAVLVNGSKVAMSLKNTTRGTRFSRTVTGTQLPDVTSAEWIAEAPSACTTTGLCRVVPLANFGSVTFSNAAATANQVTGTISDPTWLATPIRLIPDEAGGSSGAAPGTLSADGRSFRISWQQQAEAQGAVRESEPDGLG
jgi:hypothetical protein